VTIELSTTDKRDGKALALFARCAEWQTGHTKDGRSFFAIPGSEPGLLHMTDQRDCSCQDRQRSRNVCKHMRAVRLWMAAFATGAVAPKPRPACSSQADDLVILTPDGAAYLLNQSKVDPTQRPEPADADGSRAYLAKLQADQAAHAVALRRLDRDPQDDGAYLQRAEWIAKLEARHQRQERDVQPAPTSEQLFARGREILAAM
jgi:hypothetical protein